MILSTNGNLWAIAGVIYALAGATLICNALFLTPTPGKSTAADSFALRRQYEQWLDYRVGAVLIAVGFFLQVTGAFGSETLRVPAAFVLLGLALAAAYYALMKGLFVERLMATDDKVPHEKPLALVRAITPQVTAPVVVPQAGDVGEAQGVAG
jgi:drug/metabolite transporter (DMT)-like permease